MREGEGPMGLAEDLAPNGMGKICPYAVFLLIVLLHGFSA
jgi:hypothetical protein